MNASNVTFSDNDPSTLNPDDQIFDAERSILGNMKTSNEKTIEVQ